MRSTRMASYHQIFFLICGLLISQGSLFGAEIVGGHDSPVHSGTGGVLVDYEQYAAVCWGRRAFCASGQRGICAVSSRSRSNRGSPRCDRLLAD
jgi:hypothetical protein